MDSPQSSVASRRSQSAVRIDSPQSLVSVRSRWSQSAVDGLSPQSESAVRSRWSRSAVVVAVDCRPPTADSDCRLRPTT